MPNLTAEMKHYLPEETALADKIQHRRAPFTLPYANDGSSMNEIAQAANYSERHIRGLCPDDVYFEVDIVGIFGDGVFRIYIYHHGKAEQSQRDCAEEREPVLPHRYTDDYHYAGGCVQLFCNRAV